MYSNNSGKKLSDLSDQSDQSDLSDKIVCRKLCVIWISLTKNLLKLQCG